MTDEEKKIYNQAIQDVLDTIWFDTQASKRPDALFVLSRLQERVQAKLKVLK